VRRDKFLEDLLRNVHVIFPTTIGGSEDKKGGLVGKSVETEYHEEEAKWKKRQIFIKVGGGQLPLETGESN